MVYVYLANISNLPDPLEVPEIMDGLLDSRKDKIIKCKQLKSRKQSLGAGLLLQKALEIHGKSVEEIYYINNRELLSSLFF